MMKIRSYFICLLLVILAVTGVACQPAAETKSGGHVPTPVKPNSVKYPITVIDQSGQKLTIEKEPQRIVSIIPSNTEIAYALKLDEKMVAVTTNDNYPEQVKKLPKVGDMNINIEQVVVQKPDLVLASSDNKEVVQKIQELGIPVLVLNAKSVKETIQSIHLVAQATNRTYEAEQLVVKMNEKLRAVAAVLTQVPKKKRLQVFMGDSFTPGGGTLQNEMIELAGGKNVAGSLNGWPQISPEQVIKWNPEAIILSDDANTEKAIKSMESRPGWNQIKAVQQKKFIKVNQDIISRPGPRVAEGVEELAKQLYPELFR